MSVITEEFMPKQFLKIDYKGKHFVIQDRVLDVMDFEVGKISKEDALKPEFVKAHKECCLYYGIPDYIGDDKEMNEAYP